MERFKAHSSFVSVAGIILIFASLSSSPSYAQNPVDPGALFLESFGSACSSRGIFTQKALSQTTALKQILETIKDDEACRGLTPVFRSLIDVSQQIDQRFHYVQDSKREDLENYTLRLQYMLAITSNPFEEQYLSEAIADSKIRLAYYDYERGGQIRESKTYSSASLVNYLEVVQSNYADQLLCFERHKSLPIQMAGHLLSLSGGFFDPALGLALSLSGRLISTFFSFFDDVGLVKKIQDYRKTTMMAGLTCAMEALEQTVCDIQDRRALLNRIEDYREHDEIAAAWLGYELLRREYPIVQNFLRRVEAGSPASSIQQGNQRATYRLREGVYNAIIERLLGAIGQAETELAEYPPDHSEARMRRLRTLLNNLAGNLLLEDSNVFREIIPDARYEAALLWLRIGDPTPLALDTEGNQKSRDQILRELDSGAAPPQLLALDEVRRQDIQAIRRHVDEIIQAAQTQLDVERQINIIADPQGALVEWTTSDGRTFSAGVIMEKIVAYLQNLEAEWSQHLEWFDGSVESQKDQLFFVQDTRRRFEQVVQILKTPNDKFTDPLNEKLGQIYRIMVLKEKDTMITDRMNQIVLMDLEKRLRAGLLISEENLDTTIRLSTRDIIQSLTPGSKDRVEAAKVDLDFAEPIARNNLLHFFKHFRKSIRDSIQHLLNQATAFKESPTGVSTRLASKLCILALNDPLVFQDSELVQVCDKRWIGMDDRGLVAHDYLGQPIFAAFSSDLAKLESRGWKGPEDRLCTYRRYQNKKELHLDVLRHRPSRFYSSNTSPQAPGSRRPFENAPFDPFAQTQWQDRFQGSR